MDNTKKVGRKATKSGDSSDRYTQPFATQLRALMAAKKCTQQQLAEKVGTSRQSVGYWCNGDTAPDIVTAGAIADYFGVSTDYLLGRSKSPTITEDIAVTEKTTGLTAQSIKALQSISINNAKVLNEIIKSEAFIEIATNISNGIEYCNSQDDGIKYKQVMCTVDGFTRSGRLIPDDIQFYEYSTQMAAVEMFNNIVLFTEEGE